MSAFSSYPFFTPGAIAAFVVTWVLLLVPLFVVLQEDKQTTTRKLNLVCTWLFFHIFEIILVGIAVVSAVWFMEHGRSFAWAAANCLVVPALWIAGTMIFSHIRNVLRSRSVNRSK